MAVPKKKSSKRRTRQRRAHQALTVSYSHCPKCGEAVKAHQACANCGFYGEHQVIDVETKLDKKLKKKENSKEKQD